MVVIVDLDDEPAAVHVSKALGLLAVKPLHHSLTVMAGDSAQEDARPNPNVNGFSAALSCYPIVRQLASQLDLNTLHSLSRTCRQFRANLLEYRDQLVKHSLQCKYEDEDAGAKLGLRLRELHANYGQGQRFASGKLGRCARDMVGECHRCGSVVCRNCIIKPPPTSALLARHRRLCRTCTKAPLALLTAPRRERSSSNGTASPPGSPTAKPTMLEGDGPAFTASAFERTPCSCDSMVWLCHSCGQDSKKKDVMYVRAWSWRTRYSHYLGGVGTGAGEGNEGVECGRGSNCLAAKIVEHEIECDAQTLASLGGSSPERWRGTSYHAQEIEAIGGGFKMKAKKHVRVGECVKVYEDERDRPIQHLEREVRGKLRSWCSWCERVVLGEKDLAVANGLRPTSSGGSSSSSG